MNINLTEDQAKFLLSALNTQRQKIKWVIDNKELEDDKKQILTNKIKNLIEIIQLLEKSKKKLFKDLSHESKKKEL